MGLKALVEKIQGKLESYFVSDKDKEWITLSLEAGSRIDAKIVSNRTIDKKNADNFINITIDEINNLDEFISFKMGFIEYYTVDEAEILGIEKKENKLSNIMSFGDIVDNINKINISNSNNKAKIISFYSYKGGVGRTVSLIQTAYNLAKQGKKVALIDLDIEAPSFNSIFKDDIKNSNGLLNYLFNQYINKGEIIDDKISSIVSKLNINTNGEMYIVPCGEVSIKYVKELHVLKEKIIYDNNYIKEVINKITEEYDIDYVFIDSRTGINNWGALAIADIADEVFLVGYPNYENLQGLNLILQLVKDIKKCTVIFSRIDPSPNGKKIAENLFNKLNIYQSFIGIYYDSTIALSDRYPIESEIDSFNVISDFILEDEKRIKNEKWIKDESKKVKEILEKMSDKSTFDSIITNSESKILNYSNSILIMDESIDILKIINSIDNGAKVNYIKKDYFEYFEKKISGEIGENSFVEIMGSTIGIILTSIYSTINDKCLNNEEFEFKFNNIVSMYIDGKGEFSKLVNLIEDLGIDLDRNIECILINFNGIYLQIKSRLSKILREELIIKTLLLSINMINIKHKLQVKLLVANKDYETYKEEFNEYNANILNLSWSKVDNVERLSKSIEEILKLTSNLLLEDDFDMNIFKNINKFDNMNLDMNIFKNVNSDRFDNMNLLYCKRIDSNKYSDELNLWMAKELIDKPNISKKFILDILSNAGKIEKEKKELNRDSIISFDSIKKSVEYSISNSVN